MVATPAHPILSDPQWFSKFLATVLAKSVSILGADAPTRTYVSPGTPVPDCGQLTVHFERVRASQRPTQGQQNPMGTHAVVTVADVVITLQRCVQSLTPAGDIPTAETLDEAGRDLGDLAQLLWFGLLAATLDGTLFPTQERPPVLWRDMTQVAPQAGMAGLRATMEVTLA